MSTASTPTAALVDARLDGALFRITLRRPPLNILDLAALEQLTDALVQAGEIPRVKAILLGGEGRAFCAGVEVADHTAERVEAMIAAFHRVVAALLEHRHPVVAAVHGAALGGGMELALASDVVLLREDAKLGQPEIRLGVFPPAAAALLPGMIGRQRAADLILSGRTLDAGEALAFGLASRVFETERFDMEVDRYVARLVSHSGPVLRLAKRALRAGCELPHSALAEADRLYLGELMRLDDPHEGIAAFMEKREPVWKEA